MPLPSLRALVLGGLAVASVALAGLVAADVQARDRAIETPRYEVVATYPDFEVRRYAPRLVAEVEVEGPGPQAANDGFRALARYIFGDNTRQGSIAMTAPVDRQAASEPIAMTAPVDRRAAGGDRWIITFTMPSAYTLETIPRPNDPRVALRQRPPTRYAAVRFSGAPGERRVEERMQELAAAVAREGLAAAGAPPIYARYDPPWTLPMFRRNELLLELAPEPAAGE